MQEVALTNHDRQFVEQVRRRFAVWFGELRRVLGHSWAIFHNARVKPAGVGYQRSSPAAPDGLSGLLLYSVARQGCPIAAGHDCDGYHTGRGKVRVPADLLRPCDADQMTPSKVSPAVGNTRKKARRRPKTSAYGDCLVCAGSPQSRQKTRLKSSDSAMPFVLLASQENSSWNTLLTALKTLDSLRLCFTTT